MFTYTTPIDTPLDKKAGTPLGTDFAAGFITMKTATTQGYKTGILQRLANPWAAYDATLNPYITVDWLPIDLTIFNGEQLQLAAEEARPRRHSVSIPAFAFPFWRSAARGPVANPQTPDLWTNSYSIPPTLTSVPRGSNSLVFDYNLPQTLGFLNTTLNATQLPWTPGSGTGRRPVTPGAADPFEHGDDVSVAHME